VKIALFSDTLFDANGVSRFLQDMAKQSNAKDDKLHIFTSTQKIFSHLELKNIHNIKPILRFPMPFYNDLDFVIPNFFELKREILSLKPSIIHISTPGSIGIYAKKLAKKYNLALVGTYHTDFPEYVYRNLPFEFMKSLAKSYMKWFYKEFDLVLLRSRAYEDILVNEIGIDRKKLRVLKYGTDIDRFNPIFKNRFNKKDFALPKSEFNLLYVGRLTKEKNFHLILELFKELNTSEDIDINFIVVGSGECSKQLGGVENLYYLGKKQGDELSYLYAMSDAFVSMSVTETLGQTILEALASGTPAIVSNLGGQKDFIDEKYCIIHENLDVSQWRESVLKLYRDREKLNMLSLNARKKLKTLSIEESYEHFLALHNKA